MAKKAAKSAASPATDEAPKKKADGAPAKGEAYVVFARRFRPNSFAEVAGQSATTGALKQALTTGRLHQAYLFCGPRGVGKTSLARILAKALNCLKGKGPGGMADEPCNECDACVSIQEGRALDVIEMDAATNRGIEEVRALRDNVGLAPAELRYKVYIIDEVHMLTKEAWNAFLKTLEEPPAHVKFVFATTDPNNVPETILSRCQRYDLRRIGPADIVKRLKQICELEKVEFDEMALSRIAGLSRGGLRDAEGLLDQAVNLGGGKVTDAVVRDLSGATPDELILDMLKDCAEGKTAGVLQKAHGAIENGADPEDILSSLVERLRATLLSKVCGADTPLLEGQTHLKSAYADLGGKLSEDQILMLIQVFTQARRQLRDATQTRLPLEMALIRASRAGDLVELGKLVSALESNRPAAAGPPARPPTAMAGGQRPNSAGRPEGTVESRQAAEPTPGASRPSAAAEPPGRPSVSVAPTPANAGFPSKPVAPVPVPSAANDAWSHVVAAVRAQKAGMMVATGLSHAAAVKLDVDSGTLQLGFSAEQLLYKETMGRDESHAILTAALRNLFSKDFTITIERAASNTGERSIKGAEKLAGLAPPAAPVSKFAPTPAQPRASSSASGRQAVPPAAEDGPDIADMEPDGDAEVEFADDGALPLPSAHVSRAGDVGPVRGDDDEDAPAYSRPAPLPAPAEKTTFTDVPKPVDIKTVQEHPLIKLVVKDSEGEIKRVTRSNKNPKSQEPGAKG